MAKPRNGGGGGPSDTEVESNLTSMLDLIFNVLAFFVVTFNPPKPEKNFDVALPPPKQEESQSTQELPDLDQEPELFDALTITLAAGPGGALAAVNVDGAPVDGGLNGLSRDLRIKAGSIGGVTGKKLETATVVASPHAQIPLPHPSRGCVSSRGDQEDQLHSAGRQRWRRQRRRRGLAFLAHRAIIEMAIPTYWGPEDHGHPVSLEQFSQGQALEGYRCELILGRVYVSPLPDAAQESIKQNVLDQLRSYARDNPAVINHVADDARVFVPAPQGTTCPHPDIAAYGGFPSEQLPTIDWQSQHPLLLVDVMGPADSDRILQRNVGLYLRTPSILEYWVVDLRQDITKPALRVYEPEGERWRVADWRFGTTYSTMVLPGFELTITLPDTT